jgi:hypothetical protein
LLDVWLWLWWRLAIYLRRASREQVWKELFRPDWAILNFAQLFQMQFQTLTSK